MGKEEVSIWLNEIKGFVEQLENFQNDNKEIQRDIDRLSDSLKSSMMALFMLQNTREEIESKIFKEIEQPYLRDLESVRLIKEYIGKQNEIDLFVLKNENNYQKAILKIIDVKSELVEEEAQEKKDETEEKIQELSKIISEYNKLKKNPNIESESIRIELAKQKALARKLNTKDFIAKEIFTKYTGDVI